MSNQSSRPATPMAEYQPQCGAPSSSGARNGNGGKNANANADRDVDNLDDAIAKLTMTAGNAVPTNDAASPSSKENVRPNSGKKKSWKKKSHRHRDAAAALAATTSTTPEQQNSNNDNPNAGRAPQLKNKKAVVVEISPQDSIPIIHRPILPSMDFQVPVDASGGGGSPPSSTNDDATAAAVGGSGSSSKSRNKPNRHRKQKKNQQLRNEQNVTNDGSWNGMNAGASTAGEIAFSTNPEGASVLALLGQYSYASPTSNDGPYNGYHHNYQSDGESYHHTHQYNAQYQYGSSNYTAAAATTTTTTSGSSYDGQHQLSYDTSYCPYDATSSAMPVGYCIPVTINGVVYYHQFYGSADNTSSYYYPDHSYYNYHTEYQSHPNNDGADPNKMALNIHAPAYNPNEED